MRDSALFRTVRFGVRDPAMVHEFYADRLGLAERAVEGSGFAVRAGSSQLELFPVSDGEPTHHFAFNIPENQIADAIEWLSARIDLLRGPGDDVVFSFPEWDAHSLYAVDPAGNIVEWIARHSVANASEEEFSPRSHLEVSEVGVSVKNVSVLAASLRAALALRAYRPSGETFATVGDERGLFVLSAIGRPWFPSVTESMTGAVEVEIAGIGTPRRFSPPGTQLHVDVRPAEGC